MTEQEFMDKIAKYPGWNKGMWTPWTNDCHDDVQGAFDYAGVSNPGAPNGRINIDDDAAALVKKVVNQAGNWVRERTQGSCCGGK